MQITRLIDKSTRYRIAYWVLFVVGLTTFGVTLLMLEHISAEEHPFVAFVSRTIDSGGMAVPSFVLLCVLGLLNVALVMVVAIGVYCFLAWLHGDLFRATFPKSTITEEETTTERLSYISGTAALTGVVATLIALVILSALYVWLVG